MKNVQDYSAMPPVEPFEFVTEEEKTYNRNADFKDYDSLNLFKMKTSKPESDSNGNTITNILDIIFAKTKDRDFFVTKWPHYRKLPKDLSDLEI